MSAAKPIGPSVIDGECERCGMPGIVGMTCPECSGHIINFMENKPAAKSEDNDRYAKEELLAVPLNDEADETL